MLVKFCGGFAKKQLLLRHSCKIRAGKHLGHSLAGIAYGFLGFFEGNRSRFGGKKKKGITSAE